MSTLEAELRELIREIVRSEVRVAIADATRAEEYLSPRAAAAVAAVAAGTIRRWIREGKLAGHHAGSAVRVARGDLEKLLREGPERELTPEERARRRFG